MIKSKIKTAIRIVLFTIIAVLFIITYLKLKNIEQNLGKENSGLVNITPTEKTNDIEILQSNIKNILSTSKNSIAAIYAKKIVWTFVDEESGEEKNIETIESLEWNAIVINKDWYLLTNKHVIQELEKSSYSAILQWERYPIDKIRIDDTLDIAILKITVKNETIPLNIAKLDEQGEIWDIVFAIKNDAENWEFVTKMWIINSLNKKFEIQNNNSKYVWLIKNSTAIEWWFSGWPLINIKGEIVWLNTAIDNIEYSASYAIPLSQELISQTINTIKSNGKIIRPYLWIQYEESDFRAKITWIDEWSPASKTNLKVWDIIYWIDNHEVKYSTFLYTLYTYKIWKQITINTIENWHKKDTQLTIGQKE